MTGLTIQGVCDLLRPGARGWGGKLGFDCDVQIVDDGVDVISPHGRVAVYRTEEGLADCKVNFHQRVMSLASKSKGSKPKAGK